MRTKRFRVPFSEEEWHGRCHSRHPCHHQPEHLEYCRLCRTRRLDKDDSIQTGWVEWLTPGYEKTELFVRLLIAVWSLQFVLRNLTQKQSAIISTETAMVASQLSKRRVALHNCYLLLVWKNWISTLPPIQFELIVLIWDSKFKSNKIISWTF